MEKSVLLELLEKRNKSYENMVREASIFKLSKATVDKINELFYKMNSIDLYVQNTNIKDTTIAKINDATTESVKVIGNASDYVINLLRNSVGEIIATQSVENIEKIITKNIKKDTDRLTYGVDKKALTTNKGKAKLSDKAINIINSLKNKELKLTKESKDILGALDIMIVNSYLYDSTLDTNNRLAAIPFKNDQEDKLNDYLDQIGKAISSTKINYNKSSVETKAAGVTTKAENNNVDDNKDNKSKEKEVRKVKKVTKTTTKVEEKNKKTKGRIAALIAAGVITLGMLISLPFILKGCKNNKNNKPADTTKEPGIETTTEPVETEAPFVIPTININDETKLEEYAKYIQDELKKSDVDMSIEDIKNAIKLVNVDYLEEKPFENREQVYNATEDAGKIATKLGTSSVLAEDPAYQNNIISERTLDDMMKNVVPTMEKASLNLTRYENGYSIYNILDQLTYILNNEDNIYSPVDRENAAKLFNEVMARKVRTFTLTPNSSVGQYYLAMGMYEAEHQNVKDLTAGRLYGPMYGDEETIDGSYGFICVEELQKYTKVGNTDNAFYTTYADMMLKDKTLTKSIN